MYQIRQRQENFTAAMFNSERFTSTLNKVLQGIVFAYQGAAVLSFAIALIFANQWLKLPFLGATFEQTMAYNGSGPTASDEGWDLYKQGIQLGEQLVTVAGRDIHNAWDLRNALAPFSPGENIPVVTRTVEGAEDGALDVGEGRPVARRGVDRVMPGAAGGRDGFGAKERSPTSIVI